MPRRPCRAEGSHLVSERRSSPRRVHLSCCAPMGVSQTLMERLGAEYAAMSRLDWEALFADVAPDFELVTPERSPSPGVWRGAGRARDMFRDFFSPFEEISVEPQEFFERDDLVVVFYTQQSRPA